ncbi:alpha/beta hydrolase [Salinisphaera sp. P385]|uniref:Alpha/beta hydrolase n=1 Tax=Spectribacter acetivorans TaxID=3075603 RepID=A0ABU3B9S4_9GAMM|nr:alpha/beta hydrolase [Salinisphaera sp. P385]MDT0618989.1 alpha/beta hydrolase [Salinisphaera sp. P385]
MTERVQRPAKPDVSGFNPLQSLRRRVGQTRDALTAASHLFDTRAVSRETAELAREMIAILRGDSAITIDPKDKRFRDPTWEENPFFRRLAQTYFAFCRAVDNSVAETGDWKEHERAEILADIVTSSLSPTNLLFSNPAALKRAVETRGGSLVNGLRNFLTDLRQNGGMPRHVDRNAFAVGKDLAVSPGAVVFRNEVLEILQYKPQCKQVHKRPILVMSPQINKFYFMDLAPGRSFIEYAAQNGIQIFVVSWRNPGPEQSHWNFETYIEALLEAIDAVLDITKSPDLNTMGFCAGGITQSALLGHMTNRGDKRVHSLSYAVTLLDFSVPTMVGALNNDQILDSSRRDSARRGVLPGKTLRTLFAWFRPNDLVWTFWVNNYLMGNDPPKFDILAWNNDSTNLPAGLHADFLDVFQNNPIPAGELEMFGERLDLSKLKMDAFVTGAVNDHLTPWRACYRTTQLLGGKSQFLLSNAGHVASLVNPPGNPKASYFRNDTNKPPADPDQWYADATQETGSWWEYWLEWIQARSGEKKNAPRKLGSKNYPALDPAPGTYIFEEPGEG